MSGSNQKKVVRTVFVVHRHLFGWFKTLQNQHFRVSGLHHSAQKKVVRTTDKVVQTGARGKTGMFKTIKNQSHLVQTTFTGPNHENENLVHH
jgi:hypothetical protein